jgi:hypothetical protein
VFSPAGDFCSPLFRSCSIRFSFPQHDSPSGGIGFISVPVCIPALIFVRTARFYDFILPDRFSRAGDRASSDFPCRQEAVGIYFVAAFSVLPSGARGGIYISVFVPARSGLSCLNPSRVFLLLGRHSAPASHFAGRFWDPLRFHFLL